MAFVEWKKFLKRLKEVWNNSEEANKLREDYLVGMIRCCGFSLSVFLCMFECASVIFSRFCLISRIVIRMQYTFSFVLASKPGIEVSLTPDDDVFQHLATVYANNHPTMHKAPKCPNREGPTFPGGIVNGAAWYSFNGTAKILCSFVFTNLFLQ